MAQVWAVGMMRDEQDVAYAVLDHLANEAVDGIVVADNRSTDGTRDELERAATDLPVPVVIIDDREVGYRQSEKMTVLAALAAQRGATWIVPFDADELWLARTHHLGETLRRLPEPYTTVPAVLLNHFCTALDGTDPNPFVSMQWRKSDPGVLPKVAFRWQPGAVIHQGNHGVTLPDPGITLPGELAVRHFPYRSAEHFVRKARNGLEAYRATDLPYDQGAHWRSYGEILERHGEQACADVFREHFWYLSPIDGGMVHDPAPFKRWG